ncbi:MAG: glycosyl hydrolase-related protein [Gemmatimonadaceae bacterium]
MTADAFHPLHVCVVVHTHWDREWYHPVGRFRQRLVALLDELLDAPELPDAAFLLDGQTVLLDDYLAVRPERRDALREALQRGALEAGPWYVLGDELIPSGEALVRNLLEGRHVLRRLHADSPPVLYSPDAFGHPAMLPAIASGFGFPLIILWRGYGGPTWPPGDSVRWRAPDGSTVLLYHLPPDGYEFGSALPDADSAAALRWARVRDVLEPRATLGVALLPSGADHHARQRGLAAAVSALARAARPAVVSRSSLAEFAGRVVRRAADATLPVVRGELRDSYGYAWTLQGTFASRAAQKRRYALAERLLTADVEPWAALLWARSQVDQRPLVHSAWRTLLLCQPHDTLCGCSSDTVARAMDARLDDAEAQACGLREDALLALAGVDPDAVHGRREEWRSAVLVRNRCARPRSGVADIDVVRVVRPAPVGPGSAGFRAVDAPDTPFMLRNGTVPLQLLGASRRHDRVEAPRHYPVNDVVRVIHAVAWVDAAPACGLTALSIDATAETATPAIPESRAVLAGAHWMENAALRVEVLPDGAVRFTSRDAPFTCESLIGFEDVGDVGDLYTHSPRSPVVVPVTFLGAHVMHEGPLRAELRASWRLHVPVESHRDARARATRALTVHASLVLDAGAPFLRVHVWGDNGCADHRLRIVFATGLAGGTVQADAAFAVVERTRVPVRPGAAETPPRTAPLARHVTVVAQDSAMTIYSDGLAEYEVTPAGGVAITLLRAVGELSRPDLPERPGHAGWPLPTPEAQSLGPFQASFAILAHATGAAALDLVERVAADVLLPLEGSTLRFLVTVPADVIGFALQGEGLVCSSIKQAESGTDIVLRCVNRRRHEVQGSWQVAFPVAAARRARLDETPLHELEVDGNRVNFRAGPGEIVTVLVSRGDETSGDAAVTPALVS